MCQLHIPLPMGLFMQCSIVCWKTGETEVPSVQVVREHLVYHRDLDVHLSRMLPFLPDHKEI